MRDMKSDEAFRIIEEPGLRQGRVERESDEYSVEIPLAGVGLRQFAEILEVARADWPLDA